MAAGMHLASDLRRVCMAAGFLDGQGVHIGPHHDRPVAVTVTQEADHAGLSDTFVHFDTHIAQRTCDAGSGAMLFKSQLGMLMQIPANCGHLAR